MNNFIIHQNAKQYEWKGDDNGDTALSIAKWDGHLKVVDYLKILI